MESTNKTYEVIEDSVNAVNLNNETVKTFKKGEDITGTLVLIDEKPFIELPKEIFVSTTGLAEKLDDSLVDEVEEVETTVKASNKKMIYALVGGAVGFGIAHFVLKYDTKKKIMVTVGGVALALGIEYINARKK